MKTASIVIGGRITDLERKSPSQLEVVLMRHMLPLGPYVVAEVTAVHTHKCARGERGRRVHKRDQPWRCICGAEAMLAKLLGDEAQPQPERTKP